MQEQRKKDISGGTSSVKMARTVGRSYRRRYAYKKKATYHRRKPMRVRKKINEKRSMYMTHSRQISHAWTMKKDDIYPKVFADTVDNWILDPNNHPMKAVLWDNFIHKQLNSIEVVYSDFKIYTRTRCKKDVNGPFTGDTVTRMPRFSILKYHRLTQEDLAPDPPEIDPAPYSKIYMETPWQQFSISHKPRCL